MIFSFSVYFESFSRGKKEDDITPPSPRPTMICKQEILQRGGWCRENEESLYDDAAWWRESCCIITKLFLLALLVAFCCYVRRPPPNTSLSHFTASCSPTTNGTLSITSYSISTRTLYLTRTKKVGRNK